jgi:hypothetical protein
MAIIRPHASDTKTRATIVKTVAIGDMGLPADKGDCVGTSAEKAAATGLLEKETVRGNRRRTDAHNHIRVAPKAVMRLSRLAQCGNGQDGNDGK